MPPSSEVRRSGSGAHTALLVSGDVPWALSLAAAWVGAGDSVTAVLLDTAVTAARPEHLDAPALRAALQAGVALAVEEHAMLRSGLRAERLVEGVKVLDLDEVADLLADGADKAVWL